MQSALVLTSLPREVYQVMAEIGLESIECKLANSETPPPELIEKRRLLRKFLGRDPLDADHEES